MSTNEFIDTIMHWDGLLYEHNINQLKEILYAAKRLQLETEKRIQDEERYS